MPELIDAVQYTGFNINEDNIEEVLSKALRGVQTYLEHYADHSGVQLFHNGFFSPRYHGKAGEVRALICANNLQANEIQTRVVALYELLAGAEGPTLKESVLHSFDQYNVQTICSGLEQYMKENFLIDVPEIGKNGAEKSIFPDL